MNYIYITPQALKDTIKDLKTNLKSNVDVNQVRKITRIEIDKVFKSLPKGVDKSEILPFLEENLKGEKNKAIIIATVKELLGKENWKGDNYTGGWNEQQDTSNIHKVFGEKNFTNDEYTGGWNKTQDTQNLKQSLTDGEAKTITANLIEQKLGGPEKFHEGIYQAKPEIITTLKKELTAEGELLPVLHDIFGPDKFYPKKGGENVPPGREGKYKDDREIALLQAKYQAEIKATEDWLKFFKKHLIPADKETLWRDKFGSNVEGAEELYEDAKTKGKQIVGGNFDDDEKRRIDKEAHTPDEIQQILADIPQQRKKLAWDAFFREREGDSRINKEWESNWRNGELSVGIAEKIYANGWNNSPNGLINKDKIIETYTTKTIVKGQSYEKTTKNINPLKHLAEEVDQAHDFIVKEIDLQTDLNKFPTNETIEGAYNEKKVPDTINHEEVQKLRDNRIKSLFKQYFQGSNPTKLTDSEIELWRTSPTGLPNTGKDQRQAFDNGWTNPKDISEGKISYQGIIGIKVLKVNKKDIDTEIAKVDNLVKQINSYQFLRDLDANQAKIDQQFKELKRDLLPLNKDQEITKAVKKQRDNLWYYLTDPKDGGIEENKLKEFSKEVEKNSWQMTNYEPITTKMLNEFISADQDVKALDLFKEGEKWEDLNSPNEKEYGLDEKGRPHSWLSKEKGYVIDKKTTDLENDLHISQKGTYLLEFFYKKCKDANNFPFNPRDLNKETSFCRIGTREFIIPGGRFSKDKTKTVPAIGGNKGNAGHLAIGTGVGKSTKLINCLVRGGERHVILVCPTTGLVEAAFKHHTGFLPKWGCVYCGSKGDSEMAYCLKGTYQKATEQEIAENKHDPELKTIYKSHGPYPVAKNDLAYWQNANTGKAEGMEWDAEKQVGKKGLSIMYFGHLLGFASRNLFVESGGINSWSDESLKRKVKEKLIPDDTIIVFDEADENDAGYQALQFEMINLGYNVVTDVGRFGCLRMSATFPGSEFSATSSFPIKRVYSGKLDPNMPANLMMIENIEHAEKLADLRGVDVSEIKWKDEKGKLIPVEVNLEERLQVGTTWYFGKSLKLNNEQIKALGSNVKYVIYSEDYDENCEDVSHGQPKGAFGIVDERRARGYTPGIDTVVCSGAIETKKLGNYFSYSKPTLGFTPISSLVQQQGRVGRIRPGLAITLTKTCQEIDVSDNVSAAMVRACFDGNIKQINDKDYGQIYDIDILRGALSYPSSKTFGKAPEEILMGLKVSEKQIKGKIKLDKLEWREDTPEDEKEAKSKPWYSSAKPDDELWGRYLGRAEKVVMDAKTALKTLKEMIANFITQDELYPYGLDLVKKNKFIGTVFSSKLEDDKGNEIPGAKEPIIKETRTVLNGLIKTKLYELSEKGYDETNKRSKDPNIIKKLAGLYKLTGAKIDYKKLKNDEGKLVWSLIMTTQPARAA